MKTYFKFTNKAISHTLPNAAWMCGNEDTLQSPRLWRAYCHRYTHIRHIGRETIDLAYTSFSLQKVHISWPHRTLLYVPRGLYKSFSFTLMMVVLLHFYEHILSHFVISYSIIRYFVIRYLFINVCTYFMICVQLFVIRYSLWLCISFSTITYQYSG